MQKAHSIVGHWLPSRYRSKDCMNDEDQFEAASLEREQQESNLDAFSLTLVPRGGFVDL